MPVGLLEIRRGKGTYVQEVASSGMTDAQVLLMLSDGKALEDLIEVRLTLEPLVVRLAAGRGSRRFLRAEQHDQGAVAAFAGASLRESDHFLLLHQPGADLGLEPRAPGKRCGILMGMAANALYSAK